MTWAPGITLRPWTVGGTTTTEAGEPLFTRAKITASRSLMLWGATGWRYESATKTITSTEGTQLSAESPVCDQSGWRTENNAIIDVSVPNSYTHTYTIKVSQFRMDGAGREIPVGAERTYANVYIPTADLSPFDLDLMLPVSTVAGGVVLVPDSWDQRVAAAEALIVEPTFEQTAASESATLGAELVTGTGWTVGAGWSGSYAAGFTHAAGGGVAPLTWPLASGTGQYFVQFAVDSATNSSAFTVTLGGSYGMVMYEGAAGGTWTYKRGITSVADGNLVFTPETGFDGRIHSVSVKAITAASTPAFGLEDSASASVLQIRTGTASMSNLFIGQDAGRFNVSGTENVALGKSALSKSASGFWNVAIGAEALRDNTNGTRNVAIGRLSLRENITGHRNMAVGPFSLTRNTHGVGNVALGYDTLWVNTTGSYNVAIGGAPLGSCVSGNHNIAMGQASMDLLTTGERNVALGQESLGAITTGSDSVAIGFSALKRVTASQSVGIGRSAASFLTSGVGTVAIGTHAGLSLGTGNNNVAIGHYALGNGTAGDQYEVTVIGAFAGQNLAPGSSRNTFIGASAGQACTTGSNNLLIGRNTVTSSATASNEMNIGNIIYGDMIGKRIRIGAATPTAVLHLPAGTASGGTAPIKLTAGTNLTNPEAGAIEFDGTNLYFTTAAGVRKTVAVV